MNIMQKLLFLLLVSTSSVIFSGVLFAAEISAPKKMNLGSLPQMEISRLQDLQIEQLDPRQHDVTYAGNENLCIYTSVATHNYYVSVESNTSTNYELHNGKYNLPVQVWWSSETSAENAQQLQPNQQLLIQNSSASSQPDCPNGLNANLQIRIKSEQLSGIPDGAYNATFNVIITAAT